MCGTCLVHEAHSSCASRAVYGSWLDILAVSCLVVPWHEDSNVVVHNVRGASCFVIDVHTMGEARDTWSSPLFKLILDMIGLGLGAHGVVFSGRMH